MTAMPAPAARFTASGALTADDISDLAAAALCYRQAIALRLDDHAGSGHDSLCRAETLLMNAHTTLIHAASHLNAYEQIIAVEAHHDVA